MLKSIARKAKRVGAIVLRECYNSYLPLGVFSVRENVRNAINQKPLEFADIKAAISYILTKLKLPMQKFVKQVIF